MSLLKFLMKNIEIGKKIKIIKKDFEIEGFIIPKPELYEEDFILVKLYNGYNIGIEIDENTKIIELGEKIKVGEFPKAEIIKNSNLKNISLIHTGGTIASKIDYSTQAVSPAIQPEELFYIFPELKNIANIERTILLFNIASEDMLPKNWIKIAEAAYKEINDKEIFGVIISHGTDTMHFTSAALSFFIQNLNKPIILTGAQRSSDRASSDAKMNFICSSYAAISNIAEVGIVMHASSNDDFCYFHRGTKVRKLHTTRRDAFKSVNDKPIAKIYCDGKIEIINKNYKERNENKPELKAFFDERVAILKFYPNSKPEIIDILVNNFDIRGIVIEASGLGHVATNNEKSWIPYIKKNDNTLFAITSQCIFGRVHPYVYTNTRILSNLENVVFCEDMLSEVAYVKLGWLLAQEKDLKKLKELMLTNFANEINYISYYED
ncbi:MAG: Glu-tRNA(Gln) amidotransferase subunit GatD [Candidatus Aenigmatarchaeota archaeon]